MKKTLINVIVINLVIVLIYLLMSFASFAIDLANPKLSLVGFLFIFLLIILIIYFIIHVTYTKQKVCLIIIGSLMLSLILFRNLKYGISSQSDILSRHLWYLYYLPVLFIPYFLLVSSLSNYYEIHKKKVLITFVITGLIALVLFLLIATNDLHQLAFIFKNEGFQDWEDGYKYGIVYYLSFGYASLLLVVSFVIFFLQARIIKGKYLSFLSLVPLSLGLLYMIIYVLGLIPRYKGISLLCQFPETLCFMIVGYIFSLINLRIIATNRNYDKMFLNMSLPAFIMDKTNHIVYQNADSGLIKENCDNQVIGDYLYQNTSILGGKVTWISNIADLNAIYKELSELNNRLKEEEQLNILTNNLKEERLAVLEKDKIYDAIAKDVFEESSKIMELSREIKNDMSLFNKNMPIILLLSIYIKRFANLKLLAEENERADINELYLSINETLRYLEKMGINIALVGENKGEYSSKKLLEAYAYFSKTIFNNLNNITGVTVVFNKNYLVKINIDSKELKLLKNKDAEVNKEDDIYYITFKKEERL